jgi:hypothetical protein
MVFYLLFQQLNVSMEGGPLSFRGCYSYSLDYNRRREPLEGLQIVALIAPDPLFLRQVVSGEPQSQGSVAPFALCVRAVVNPVAQNGHEGCLVHRIHPDSPPNRCLSTGSVHGQVPEKLSRFPSFRRDYAGALRGKAFMVNE